MANESDRDARKATGEPTDDRVDADAARDSMARLMDIYRDISATAERQAEERCPYKDSRSRCTAQFKCRNQHFVAGTPGDLAICTGSDKLDYRKAWQVE